MVLIAILYNKAVSPVVWQSMAVLTRCYSVNTSYAGRSQIGNQLVKAVTPESVNGRVIITTKKWTKYCSPAWGLHARCSSPGQKSQLGPGLLTTRESRTD